MGPCAPHVVVLGSGLGGLTTALTLATELGPAVEVTVVSPTARSVHAPWLVRVPFSDRLPDDLTVPSREPLEAQGVLVVQAEATAIDPVHRTVSLSTGRTYGYDHLVVATGVVDDRESLPGIGAGGPAVTVTTPAEALHAAQAWRRFVADPGEHLVVGAAPGTRFPGAAYELLFHAAYELRCHGLTDRVRLVFVTPEPHLGHLGLGERRHGGRLLGSFFSQARVEIHTAARIEAVEHDRLRLAGGTELPFSLAMLLPPSVGSPVVVDTLGLGDARGLVPVRPTFQSTVWDEVYAVGDAAAVDVPWTTGAPGDVFPVEAQARTAAAHIADRVRGRRSLGTVPA